MVDFETKVIAQDAHMNRLPRTQPAKRGWRFYGAFGSLCIINLVCALDATSLSVALPIIADNLGGTAIEAFWAGTSFLLTSTVFQPTFASFSHIFGRKPVLLVALTFFTAGAIISALAQGFNLLLVGRSVQGVGGGGIVALTYVIATDLVTLRERGKWFGLINMMWAIGSVSGPVIGGVLSERASWRWIFWINLPFCGIGFVTIPIFLRLHYKVGSFVEKLKHVDWVGTLIFVGSVTSFLVPITWGGVMYKWTEWRTLVPLLVGIAGLLGFVIYSKFLRIDRGHDPLIRGSIFRSPTALASFFGTILQGIIVSSILFYLPLYYEVAKDLSPTMAGVALFPQTLTVAPASVIVGLLIAKSGNYRWAVWSGCILTTTGMGLLILLSVDTPTVEWIFLNLVSGIGIGMLYPAMAFSIQAAASNADLPFAAAMFSFFRACGQMLGIAIGGAVFQNEMTKKLRAYPDLARGALLYSNDASALVQIIKIMPAWEHLRRMHLIQAYVDSLQELWTVMCALAGLCLIVVVMWVKDHSLERELETEQGFRHDVGLSDPELTLGNPQPVAQKAGLVTQDSEMTLGSRPETSETAPVMERTKPSELTLGTSSPMTKSAPSTPAEPKDLSHEPSEDEFGNTTPKTGAPREPRNDMHQSSQLDSADSAANTGVISTLSEPQILPTHPSQRSTSSSRYTTPLEDADIDRDIPAAALQTRDYSEALVCNAASPLGLRKPTKLTKSQRASKPSLKQQRDELLEWIFAD